MRFSRKNGVVPLTSGSADQGTWPVLGSDEEPSALRDEVVRLRAENARLLRLLQSGSCSISHRADVYGWSTTLGRDVESRVRM